MSWSDFLQSVCLASFQLPWHTRTTTCFHARLGDCRISQVHYVSLSACDAFKLRRCPNRMISFYPAQILASDTTIPSPTACSHNEAKTWPKDFTVRPYRLLISLCTLHLICSIIIENPPLIFAVSSKRDLRLRRNTRYEWARLPLLDEDFHLARTHNASWRSSR